MMEVNPRDTTCHLMASLTHTACTRAPGGSPHSLGGSLH